jgi:uncharacterized DUF497 family protein
MSFEWDVEKARTNFRKHGARFSEALPIFDDDYAITIPDEESDPDEPRFVSIGMGAKNRILLAVYCYRGKNIRIISVRLAETHERREYEENR